MAIFRILSRQLKCRNAKLSETEEALYQEDAALAALSRGFTVDVFIYGDHVENVNPPITVLLLVMIYILITC